MRVRHDGVAASSVLFTIGLLMMARTAWWNAMSGWGPNPYNPFDSDELGLYRAADSWSPIGFASLAIIAIGLIVAWTGYIRGVRWTWFVMFLIVWGWDFPLWILPSLQGWPHNDIIGTLEYGIREPGMSRVFAEDFLAFMLMLVALNLPLKAFTVGRRRGPGESGCAGSGTPKKPGI
jgi:hypothetical protein